MSLWLPVAAAALVCSAAVAAWRVWPASSFFSFLGEPGNDLLFHYTPKEGRPSAFPGSASAQEAELFQEFTQLGFHFQPPQDYWERLSQAESPFALLRPAFTLRRTESSPPSSFGIAACDFSISTDALPPGMSADEDWLNLPAVTALQARFACGPPQRYEVTTAGPQGGRFIRLVWETLTSRNGESGLQLEMWVQQRGSIAWSLTGLMPGSGSSYLLPQTMERLAAGFSFLGTDPELVRTYLTDRDLLGATPVSAPPGAMPLYQWSRLPAEPSTWPGVQWECPGAEFGWSSGTARIALLTLPGDGLEGLSPDRILVGLGRIWPALRGFTFPALDAGQTSGEAVYQGVASGQFEGKPAQCVLKWHRTGRGILLALAFQPEAGAGPAPDPAELLAGLHPAPPQASPESVAIRFSQVHLPLLENLAADALANGRPQDASRIHLAIFARSQKLENLAAACGSLAAGGRMEEAIQLFDTAGARFTHAPGWDIYRTLVLARLGAGAKAHRQAMDLLSSRRFPGSLAAPYLSALMESRSWPQARTFASMLVRNDPDSAQWRLHYATILAETGERDKAIAIIQATQQTWPDDVMLGISCTRTLLRFKWPQDAATLAARVARAHPDHEQAHLLQGQCHTLLGQNEEARLAYQRALKAAPASPTARQAITSLAAVAAQSDAAFVTQAITPVPLPAALTHGLPTAPADSHVPALTLSRITGYRHQRGRPPAATVRSRVLINDAEGMSQWNTLTFSIDPGRERLGLHHLHVLDPAGTIIARANPAERYSLETPDGKRTVHFPIPGLTPGCVIDYAATTEQLAPASAWSYSRHFFALPSPALADICYVTGDLTSLTWVHSTKQQPAASSDCLIWRQDLPPLLAVKNPSVPTLHLGTVTATWESTGRDYLEQIRHRLAPDPVITRTALALTSGIPGRRDRINSISRLVRTDISYTAIEFGYRAIIPHAPAVTLHNRYGDCKDQSVLLHSLLTAAGIPSHLALIHTGIPTHPGFPALNQFDHMIVALPDGNGGFDFIDPTDKFLEPAPGCAPHGLTSRQALLLDPARPRLVPTPAAEAPSRGTLVRNIKIGTDHRLDITDELTLTGPASADLRAVLAPLPPSAHLAALSRTLGLDRLREQLLDVRLTALRDASQPLTAHLSWQSPDALTATPGGTQLSLTTPIVDYLFFPPALGTHDSGGAVRLTTPIRLEATITLSPPPGQVLSQPRLQQPSGKSPQGSWETTLAGNTIRWTGQLLPGTWEGAAAQEARLLPSAALKPLRQPWLLTPAPPSAPPSFSGRLSARPPLGPEITSED